MIHLLEHINAAVLQHLLVGGTPVIRLLKALAGVAGQLQERGDDGCLQRGHVLILQQRKGEDGHLLGADQVRGQVREVLELKRAAGVEGRVLIVEDGVDRVHNGERAGHDDEALVVADRGVGDLALAAQEGQQAEDDAVRHVHVGLGENAHVDELVRQGHEEVHNVVGADLLAVRPLLALLLAGHLGVRGADLGHGVRLCAPAPRPSEALDFVQRVVNRLEDPRGGADGRVVGRVEARAHRARNLVGAHVGGEAERLDNVGADHAVHAQAAPGAVGLAHDEDAAAQHTLGQDALDAAGGGVVVIVVAGLADHEPRGLVKVGPLVAAVAVHRVGQVALVSHGDHGAVHAVPAGLVGGVALARGRRPKAAVVEVEVPVLAEGVKGAAHLQDDNVAHALEVHADVAQVQTAQLHVVAKVVQRGNLDTVGHGHVRKAAAPAALVVVLELVHGLHGAGEHGVALPDLRLEVEGEVVAHVAHHLAVLQVGLVPVRERGQVRAAGQAPGQRLPVVQAHLHGPEDVSKAAVALVEANDPVEGRGLRAAPRVDLEAVDHVLHEPRVAKGNDCVGRGRLWGCEWYGGG